MGHSPRGFPLGHEGLCHLKREVTDRYKEEGRTNDKNGLNIVWTGKELLQKIRERYSLCFGFPESNIITEIRESVELYGKQ